MAIRDEKNISTLNSPHRGEVERPDVEELLYDVGQNKNKESVIRIFE